MTTDRVLLVTGGTGAIGREVLRRLRPAGAFARILSLSRAPDRESPCADVVPLRGDVTLPDLGLDASTQRELEGSVTDVLHAAADTRFNRPIEEARRVNVEGTRNVMALATRCRRLTRMLHVSTAYVCGLRPGRVPERLLPRPPSFANAYQQSKHEAEVAVGEWMDDVPVGIVRVSTPIGQAADGRVPRLNYVHGILRLLPLRLSPVMAVDPEARVDLLASDWVADALTALVLRRDPMPRVLNLCAGEAEALPVSTLLEETRRAYLEHGTTDVRLPEVVPEEEYRRVVAGLRRSGQRVAARALDGLEHFLPHLRVRQVFETERATAALAGACPARPSSLETFRRVARWCLRTDFGASAEPAAAAPVLAHD